MRILTMFAAFSMLWLSPSFAEDPKPIGKIIQVDQKEDDPIPIIGNSGRRSACVDCPVYEGDVLATSKRQSITLVMDEGSELAIGPSARVKLENWLERDSGNKLSRTVSFIRGVMKVLVNKVYSEKEPFLVKSKDGIMGVRGTEFVVAADDSRLRGRERESTLSLYTVTGEVHFAKSESDLQSGNSVLARAGYHSVISGGMSAPTTPVRFESKVLNRIIKSKLPQVKEATVQGSRTYEVKEARSRMVTGPKDPSGNGESLRREKRGYDAPQGAEPTAEGGAVSRRGGGSENAAAENRPRPKLEETQQVNRGEVRGGGRGDILDRAGAEGARAQRVLRRGEGKAGEGAEYVGPAGSGKRGGPMGSDNIAGRGAQRLNPGSRAGAPARPPGGPGVGNMRPRQGYRERVQRGTQPPPP